MIEQLEKILDSFDASERRDALGELCRIAAGGNTELPEPGTGVNMHYHTFFSYNYMGYSPSKLAWLARREGLAVAGIVDFDVLEGLAEFYEAGQVLGLKVSVGMETRVFIPEFSEKVINSPGEPGISYHMGVGFPSAELAGETADFQRGLKETVRHRNEELLGRVNAHLSPVELDYEEDVLCLTPGGNATERHMCVAYEAKARERFSDDGELKGFWCEKLGVEPGELDLSGSGKLQSQIRAKTMKRGGVGYVQPDGGSFVTMADFNRFVLSAGAIPTHAWLDGMSDGEQEIAELLDVAMGIGVAAINVIPDRNYTSGAGDGDAKLRELVKVVELARQRDLILVGGTEMNSPGQKFVDDFTSDALQPFESDFLRGGHILYAHSAMQRAGGLGWTSDWAGKYFPGARARNDFFEEVGRRLEAGCEDVLSGMDENSTPEDMLNAIE